MKTITLQQFFYGRDELRDYCLLASSVDDAELRSCVEEMCETYQSPLAGGLPAPVLMTRVVGRYILFSCVRNGLRDSVGRGTIFFHVFTAEVETVSGTDVDAFRLFADGQFAERLPNTNEHISPVTIVVKHWEGPSGVNLKLPAAIEAEPSDVELFRRILGDLSNCISWVTFASRDMPGFELIGIQPGVRMSLHRYRYDAEFNIIGQPLLTAGEPTTDDKCNSSRITTGGNLSKRATVSSYAERGSSRHLWFSLILNLILAVAFVCYIATSGSQVKNEDVVNQQNAQEGVSDGQKDMSRRLIDKFDEMYPGGRLSLEELKALTDESGPLYQFTDEGWKSLSKKRQEAYAATRPVILKVLNYVDFMNKSVLRYLSEADKTNKE